LHSSAIQSSTLALPEMALDSRSMRVLSSPLTATLPFHYRNHLRLLDGSARAPRWIVAAVNTKRSKPGKQYLCIISTAGASPSLSRIKLGCAPGLRKRVRPTERTRFRRLSRYKISLNRRPACGRASSATFAKLGLVPSSRLHGILRMPPRVRGLRRLPPSRTMRWTVWTKRSRMALA
jgi:hypothetical protein